ncbi:MAG: methylated-DNA--[protein]-cysteine S-methyltransferase [Alphaproteobacteria bacterium]|nr:methylated-DNA--[protein]-cysteine S-methyltransferase [Alphaproteobacteria bacterium]
MARLAFPSPVGPLSIAAKDGAIVALDWGGADTAPKGADDALLRRARDQVLEYLAGRRTEFDLPLALASTPHQQAVWNALRKIPYGATRTYGELAAAVGSAPRAVGLACGRNPVPLIVPCHRVVGADGALVGYSGGDGESTKRWLLDLEARVSAR